MARTAPRARPPIRVGVSSTRLVGMAAARRVSPALMATPRPMKPSGGREGERRVNLHALGQVSVAERCSNTSFGSMKLQNARWIAPCPRRIKRLVTGANRSRSWAGLDRYWLECPALGADAPLAIASNTFRCRSLGAAAGPRGPITAGSSYAAIQESSDAMTMPSPWAPANAAGQAVGPGREGARTRAEALAGPATLHAALRNGSITNRAIEGGRCMRLEHLG